MASETGISFWGMLHDRLARDPAALGMALETLDRWQAEGHTAPHRLAEWRAILEQARQSTEGRETLKQALLSEDEASARLRDFHPFAGILSREERRRARELCTYRH